MPLPNKKSTTSTTDPVAVERQSFHDHLRALTRSAVRVVIEEVMREELTPISGGELGGVNP